MDLFKIAQKFTSKWENGLVDHPADPGGITKNGISLRFLQSYAKDNAEWLKEIKITPPVTAVTIRNLTKEQEEAIYERAFWNPLKPETLSSLTVVSYYDASVNSGQVQATKFLQRAINAHSGEIIAVDGLIGSKTRERAMQIGKGSDLSLALSLIEFREAFYNDLADRKPSNKVFLKGWLNRTTDLRKYLSALALKEK